MNRNDFYEELKTRFKAVVQENGLWDETVTVTGRALTDEEAIGNPDRKDFPLLTGKESLMEARFRESRGQAFTDQPGPFEGSLKNIMENADRSHYHRAVFIASLNGVMSHIHHSGNTVHCKDNQPELCACDLAEKLNGEREKAKIALVGFQPSMLEKLSPLYSLRVLDLDADKIGTVRYGTEVESGTDARDEVLDWCDMILCTGSTVVNGTLPDYLVGKPVYFYGTTIAGTAQLMNLSRFCPRSV